MLHLPNTPARQEVYLLLAARGNPDHGQDPEQPPFGVPGDRLLDCSDGWNPAEPGHVASRHVREFIDQYGLGGGNWVGGDVWENGKHIGSVAYNGRFIPGHQGPLVREGDFVFAKPLATSPPANEAEGWEDVLLSAVEASTDADWDHVFTLRPDLADRLRAVLDRVAPESRSISP